MGVDFSNEIIGNLSNLKFDSIHDLYKHVMNSLNRSLYQEINAQYGQDKDLFFNNLFTLGFSKWENDEYSRLKILDKVLHALHTKLSKENYLELLVQFPDLYECLEKAMKKDDEKFYGQLINQCYYIRPLVQAALLLKDDPALFSSLSKKPMFKKCGSSFRERLEREYTKEEVEFLIENLTDSQRRMLVSLYGENLDTYQGEELDSKTKKEIFTFVGRYIVSAKKKILKK